MPKIYVLQPKYMFLTIGAVNKDKKSKRKFYI